MTTVIDGTLGVNRVRDDAIVGGDLVFGGPASRIYGDFSNSSASQRLLFQSNVANGVTNVGALPNGTAGFAAFSVFGGPDPDNASMTQITTNANTGVCEVRANKTGSGAYLPLSFQTSATERFRLSATENRFQANFSGDNFGLSFQNNSPNASTIIGVAPNGTSNVAYLAIFGLSSMVNSPAAFFGIDSGGANSRVFVEANRSGSGTYLPLTFAAGGAERMRISAAGHIYINNPTFSLVGNGNTNTGAAIEQAAAGSTLFLSRGDGAVVLLCNINQDNPIVRFCRSGTQVGYISVNSTNTFYNTSSDYRLKENIRTMVAPLTRLLRLNPVTFDWKADGSKGEGFIAHELQEEVPLAVTGKKDGEAMQGVDFGKVVPLLVAAVQELAQKLDLANERIAALEAL